jgi:ribonuclease BN (tRNA processing enzyme)
MTPREQYQSSWENDEVLVNVPFSAAGVGTTIVLTSKFTGRIMLMDVGDGTVRDLLELTKKSDFVTDIDLIAISHGHFDHVGGLHTLLGFMRMLGRKDALNILIPTGCIEAIGIIKGFHEYYHDTLPFKIRYHETTQGFEFDTDFFKVKSFGVEHYGSECSSEEEVLMPAQGFRVKVGETVIAYSGDTRVCTGVKSVVAGADLAIIEATRAVTPDSGPRVHLSVEEATQLGALAKEHLLIHGIPDVHNSH